jgi:hypothetical protein
MSSSDSERPHDALLLRTLISSTSQSSLPAPRKLPPPVRIGVAYLASFFSAGTLGAWSSFADQLVHHGVFDGGCSSTGDGGRCLSQDSLLLWLFVVSMAFMNACSIPIGLLYDQKGPLFTSMLGFVGTMFCWGAVFLSLQFKVLEMGLWVSIALMQLMQTIATWGIFGFAFFFGSDRVGLIVGVGNSSFLASSAVLYAVVWVVARGVSLSYAVLILLVLSVCSAILTWFVVPSLEEYQASFSTLNRETKSSPHSLREQILELIGVIRNHRLRTIAYFMCSAMLNIAFNYWMGR